jgi:hypothetical protein
MRFKLWLEIVELSKPSGKVVKKTIIRDKGTNVAKPVVQFQFTTKLGNVVKLQFEPQGYKNEQGIETSYRVIFYVNDVLYDNAPKLGMDLKAEKYNRDTEILPGVFYLLKNKADKMQAQYLTFNAHKSNNDTKTIRNLDIEPYKKAVLEQLTKFIAGIKTVPVTMIKPSAARVALYQKINRPVPDAEPSFNQEAWLNWANKLQVGINSNQPIYEYIEYLQNGIAKMPLNVSDLMRSLQGYYNAFVSNTPQGYNRTINRRTSIYTRVVNRYFANDWYIKISGDTFYLTRKDSYA